MKKVIWSSVLFLVSLFTILVSSVTFYRFPYEWMPSWLVLAGCVLAALASCLIFVRKRFAVLGLVVASVAAIVFPVGSFAALVFLANVLAQRSGARSVPFLVLGVVATAASFVWDTYMQEPGFGYLDAFSSGAATGNGNPWIAVLIATAVCVCVAFIASRTNNESVVYIASLEQLELVIEDAVGRGKNVAATVQLEATELASSELVGEAFCGFEDLLEVAMEYAQTQQVTVLLRSDAATGVTIQVSTPVNPQNAPQRFPDHMELSEIRETFAGIDGRVELSPETVTVRIPWDGQHEQSAAAASTSSSRTR